MVKILNVVAALFVLLGIIGFFVSYHDVSDLKKDSEFWEQSASENYDNNLIGAEADNARQNYVSQLTISIVTLFSGIVVGIFFLALSKIIAVLEQIRDKKSDFTAPMIHNASTSGSAV